MNAGVFDARKVYRRFVRFGCRRRADLPTGKSALPCAALPRTAAAERCTEGGAARRFLAGLMDGVSREKSAAGGACIEAENRCLLKDVGIAAGERRLKRRIRLRFAYWTAASGKNKRESSRNLKIFQKAERKAVRHGICAFASAYGIQPARTARAASNRRLDTAGSDGTDGGGDHRPRRDVRRRWIFTRRRKKRGIKPIVGCEVYVAKADALR